MKWFRRSDQSVQEQEVDLEEQIRASWAEGQESPEVVEPKKKRILYIRQWRDTAGSYRTGAWLDKPPKADVDTGIYRPDPYIEILSLHVTCTENDGKDIVKRAKKKLAKEKEMEDRGWLRSKQQFRTLYREWEVEIDDED